MGIWAPLTLSSYNAVTGKKCLRAPLLYHVIVVPRPLSVQGQHSGSSDPPIWFWHRFHAGWPSWCNPPIFFNLGLEPALRVNISVAGLVPCLVNQTRATEMRARDLATGPSGTSLIQSFSKKIFRGNIVVNSMTKPAKKVKLRNVIFCLLKFSELK